MDKSVAGIIFSEDRKEVLLIKRRDVPVWVLPGGGPEIGETLEFSAKREVEEETGYKVETVRKVGEFLPKNRLTKHTYLYEFKIIGGAPHKGDETLDIKYFKANKLPRLMPPPYFEWIADSALFLSAPLYKTTQSVTYPVVLKKFLLHPILVLKHFLYKLNILKHK